VRRHWIATGCYLVDQREVKPQPGDANDRHRLGARWLAADMRRQFGLARSEETALAAATVAIEPLRSNRECGVRLGCFCGISTRKCGLDL
jgi:hypothetical protein